MIALIRKNLRLWGYGKSLALFAGCILFSILVLAFVYILHYNDKNGNILKNLASI